MSKIVKIGDRLIGGKNPVLIQSMCNVPTKNIQAVTDQIIALEKAGCDIVRVAVPDMESAEAIKEIKKNIHIPLVADIHFDYRLALASMENGIDKVRINPGNIGSKEGIKAVVDMAKEKNIPIRIGVNSGSVEKELLAKYGKPCAEALVESAKKHIDILNEYGYDNIVVSLKASDVPTTIKAYSLMHDMYDYPLHLGVTEAGTFVGGTIKSSIGIGALLSQGIGDTIRVSLTDDPVKEIMVASEILKNLGLKQGGPKFVSCPTCGRTSISLIPLAKRVEEYLMGVNKDITVAVMGCVVNGPGEAREADIGIAGGIGEGLVFKKGVPFKKVSEDMLFDVLVEEIEKM